MQQVLNQKVFRLKHLMRYNVLLILRINTYHYDLMPSQELKQQMFAYIFKLSILLRKMFLDICSFQLSSNFRRSQFLMLQFQYPCALINGNQSNKASKVRAITPFLSEVAHRMSWGKLSIKSTPIDNIGVMCPLKGKILLPKYFKQIDRLNLFEI